MSEKKSKPDLLSIFNLLLHKFGPRHWWPAESKLEVIIGAILTQNTAWKNVKITISVLKEKDLMNIEKLILIDETVLAEAIRSSGYYNQKAKKIKFFLKFFDEKYNCSFNKISKQEKSTIRNELLRVWGIGEETADSILLYALDIPSFVIDSYTKRIFHRLGYVEENSEYSQLKTFFESRLPIDLYIYNEFHALIDYLAHFICKKTPKCGECPLTNECSFYLKGKVNV